MVLHTIYLVFHSEFYPTQITLTERISSQFAMKNDTIRLDRFFFLFLLTTCISMGFAVPGIAQVVLKPSRTAGVAPLAIIFDATETTVAGSDRPFHDLDYSWNFGDTSNEKWAGLQSYKNRDKGPLAAHVFVNPGTYTVKLTVKDGNGQVITEQVSISVHDPDIVYSGNRTVCISDSAANDFSGCPADASRVATDNIIDMRAHVATNKRILLRRGSAWSTSEGAYYTDIAGPVTIGSYGNCSNPDARGICQNAPRIHVTGNSQGPSLFSMGKISDWRIQDLYISGEATRWSAAGGNTDIFTLLFYRIKIDGFNVPMGTSHWETDGHDQIMLVDSDISGGNTNGVYIGSKRLVILGSDIRNSVNSHVLRVWQAYKSIISHNFLSGSSLNSSSGRHALKLHGPDQTLLSNAGIAPNGLADPTRYVIISGNVFGGSGPWPVAIGPQSGLADERLRDIIVEKNYFIPAFGAQSCCSSGVQVALSIWADDVTVRNNVFDGNGSSRYFSAVNITKRGIEPAPTNNHLFNNTVYKSDTSTGYTSNTGFIVGNSASQTIIRNNLVSFPGSATEITLIRNSSSDLVADHNLLTDFPKFRSPEHSDVLQRDFSLVSGSPAIDSGIQVPLFDDRKGTQRPRNTYDLGAYEFNGGTLSWLKLLL